MLDIAPEDWKIIKAILQAYPYQFYIFGSRRKGHAQPFSDLDLCYKQAIPDSIITKIKGDFVDSNLPYEVDIIDWNRCDEGFKKQIEKDLLLLDLTY